MNETEASGKAVLVGNLYADVAERLDEEEFVELLVAANVRIERIVSTGQAGTPGHWLDQDWAEWVLLLRGSAGILFEGEDGPRVLGPSDYLRIPAHARHRVEWTAPDQATIWLAVHYR
jgi:cupin 2 domain-containing protein